MPRAPAQCGPCAHRTLEILPCSPRAPLATELQEPSQPTPPLFAWKPTYRSSSDQKASPNPMQTRFLPAPSAPLEESNERPGFPHRECACYRFVEFVSLRMFSSH